MKVLFVDKSFIIEENWFVEEEYLYPSPIVFLHVGHERSVIEYPWERRIKQREKVTGQRVIYSSRPINDNDLHLDQ
jgi:hypothetical protein